MKFSTSDLSKILGVTSNTIRRYEKMGYLGNDRNEENGYRQFDHTDVSKLMYVSKYRNVGFSHEEIGEMFNSDISGIKEKYSKKIDELEKQIARYKSIMHMLKDDSNLIDSIEKYGMEPFLFDCSPMHYILYQEKGHLCTKKNGNAITRFIEECPELEYIYLFHKDEITNGIIEFSEGVAANQLMTRKYNVSIDENVSEFPRRKCVLHFIKVPVDFWDESKYSKEDMSDILYRKALDFMGQNNCCLDGNAIGLKICLSDENNTRYQYVLMHFPVKFY